MIARVFSLLFITLLSNSFILKAQTVSSPPYLVGYWQNWNDSNSPYIPLDQIDSRYNVVNLSFAIGGAYTDYDMVFPLCCRETQAGLINKIQALQSRGVIVNISVGGATSPVYLDNQAETDAFVTSMNNIINAYGLDGLDIDLEGHSFSVSASSTIANPTDISVVNFINAVQQISADYQTTHGKKMFLSAAPETAFVQGGLSAWGGIWGAYLPVLDALREELDLLHVQLYNSGSMYGIDGEIYTQGTVDFLLSQVEAVIAGFSVNSGGYFAGFPASKVAIGLPACSSAAGGGFISTALVKSAVDYLIGKGPKPGNYTLQAGPYPDLGGMMTWSINWDAVTTCNSTPYEYATNFEACFLSDTCSQPNLGADVSTCGLSFPYLLDSQTPTNPNVSFTWTNLKTNQILVSKSLTANTLAINSVGTYQVERDSMGCVKTDKIIIGGTLSIPDIPSEMSLCPAIPISIFIANSNDFPDGTNWTWYKDGDLIPTANMPSYSNIRSSGTYTVRATYHNCTIQASTVVSSDLPTPIDACGTLGESLILGIETDRDGPFIWYNTSTDSEPLGTGTTFTTPALDTTTTFYVEDASVAGTITTGPVKTDDNGLGTLGNWYSPQTLYFDATSDFMLKRFTVYPLVWCSTHTISVEFRDAADNLLTNGSQSFIVSGGYNCDVLDERPVIVTFANAVKIPKGTNYKIVVTSEVGINHWEGNVQYPMDYSPFFTITGSDVAGRYLAIHDWVVEGVSCARLPVVANIDPSCGDSDSDCPTDLVITEEVITAGTYQAAESIQATGTVIDDSNAVIFEAGSSITLKSGFHVVSGGTFAASIQSCTPLIATHPTAYSDVNSQTAIATRKTIELNAYPNPFTNDFIIEYDLPTDVEVSLFLVDLLGQQISIIQAASYQLAGRFTLEVNNNQLAAGTYFVVLKTNKDLITRKVFKL